MRVCVRLAHDWELVRPSDMVHATHTHTHNESEEVKIIAKFIASIIFFTNSSSFSFWGRRCVCVCSWCDFCLCFAHRSIFFFFFFIFCSFGEMKLQIGQINELELLWYLLHFSFDCSRFLFVHLAAAMKWNVKIENTHSLTNSLTQIMKIKTKCRKSEREEEKKSFTWFSL